VAKLYFRHGVMAAAKTSNLLQVEFTYNQAGMKTILAKPQVDSKGGRYIVSRIGLAKEADLLITPEMSVKEELQKLLEENRTAGTPLACLLIDEAQFLTPEQVDQLLWLAVFENLPVLAYGLRSDFQTQAFPGSARLLTIAHSIEEVKTVCPHDGSKALFNARKNAAGEFISAGGQVAIDGEGVSYESICPKCYFEKVSDLTE
jgi:thymidine kinase